ncbi:B3 domain-containing protein Os01g0234100-like isoform X2 [Salvia miltiorrhiza]|uniref:B3 domain-containing protein Os01g0234100-like isoform X2 n=1 Tax=Salvia miltiorrhiza TaxID=226208 RepID=UPI0025AD7E9A|nr:B3 domain-containing protein Os01g0234100-like isoform X2 [Salvia miltiorrhiza]
MAVSPVHDSGGTITCKKLKRKSATPEESKAKQRSSIWEMKRRLVKQRLMDLSYADENEESITVETPLVHTPQESPPTNDVNSSAGVSNSTMERAQEVQANLSPKSSPSFIKRMLKSHVSGGFWLGLPKKFCAAHLPEQDEMVVLVGENEDRYNTRYLVEKTGLSGGWRTFSIEHKLLAEDVLVFQLIEPCKFKVHIVRSRSVTDIDGARTLQNLSFHAEPTTENDNSTLMVKMEEEDVLITETARDKCVELYPAKNKQIKDTGGSVYPSEAAPNQTGDDNDHASSETMDGIKFSESFLSFKDVKSFKDFSIHVDGLMIDAEMPLHLRRKYYELCRSQNTFLHENLMKGLNTKLAAGMISETSNIADAIRAAKPSAGAADHLRNWDTALKAFEELGMVVGFLRARIDKLLTLSRQVEDIIEQKRCERAEAKEETRRLNLKLLDVKIQIQNLDAEIDGLIAKNEEQVYVFREAAAAPW